MSDTLEFSPADILESAADYVRQGWTQGQSFDTGLDGVTYCCASGALWLAAGLTREEFEETSLGLHVDRLHPWWVSDVRVVKWRALMAMMANQTGEYLPAWNDALGRTQAQVADKLLDMAKDLRNMAVPDGV